MFTANCNCQKSNLEKVQTKSNNNGIDIASFAHQDIDRFAVLLDLWTCELNFLIHKKKVFYKLAVSRFFYATNLFIIKTHFKILLANYLMMKSICKTVWLIRFIREICLSSSTVLSKTSLVIIYQQLNT